MKLIIVESPTKSKTLAKFLTSDYQILASMGHIRDLPKKKLAIDVDNNFQPDYVVLPEKRKVISQLRQAALRAQEIILATDPDREGEAIAYHVAYLLQKKLKKTTKIVRIVFHEITDQALKQALQKKGEINQKLVEAQQARRLLDRLAGYKLSPVLWIKIRRGLSAGRVQSPAVRLIVERERQIKAFVAQEYWEIEVELKSKKSQTFTAKLTKIDNKKAKINNKKQADKVIADLEKLKFQVLDIKISKINKSAPPPFITSTMQRTASSLLRWSAKKTMREAQRLYEHGFITYHRTDSVNLSLEAVEKARDYIKNHYGNQFIPEKIKRFKVK